MPEKGEWVRIHRVILQPHERAPQVPDDTRKVPLEMWVKGELTERAQYGESCEVITASGRRETGVLLQDGLHFEHSFGDFVPELKKAGDMAVERLFGGRDAG